jgi:ABC-type uncharacterized transport system fused permease/ATPase subunit
LFHQKPLFAVLDECTSACAVAVESLLYAKLKQHNVSYITICHRPFLEKFHNTNLNLNGDGSYSVSTIRHHDDRNDDDEKRKANVRDEHSMRPSLQG